MTQDERNEEIFAIAEEMALEMNRTMIGLSPEMREKIWAKAEAKWEQENER